MVFYAAMSWVGVGLGWGGVGLITFLALAHMLDATQHHVSCTCTHGRCYATSWGRVGVGWGGADNIAHMLDATQHHVSCTCTHGRCYATSWGRVETQCRYQPLVSAWRCSAKNLLKKMVFTKPRKYHQKMDLCCPVLQIVWKMKREVSSLMSKYVAINTYQVESSEKKGPFSKGSQTTP